MSTVEHVGSFTPPDDPRPRAATRRGQLLRAEIARLRHRRLIRLLAGLALLALLGAMTIMFFTHSRDLAGARAEAQATAQQANAEQARFYDECLKDPTIPDADKQAGACGPSTAEPMPAEQFFQDPRLRADVGLPSIAIGVAAVGALVAGLIGATAVGADWSSRALLTLLTWEPRRLRLLGTRFAATAVVAAVIGLVAQAIGFGFGVLTVSLRGTWETSPTSNGDVYVQPSLIGPAHFWRDLVSLQVRGIGLVVLVALLAAAVTTLTRHTAAVLGIAFAWVAIVENAVRVLFSSRGWPRWLFTENVVAFLLPGGQQIVKGYDTQGQPLGSVLVTNLDALLYLGAVTLAFAVLAGIFLQRRDL